MPVFPSILMCRLTQLRTQVRTVSVRIYIPMLRIFLWTYIYIHIYSVYIYVYTYTYIFRTQVRTVSVRIYDLCVQTATSVDCVNDWDVQGTENCSRPQDCELQSPVRKLRKTQLKENMALAISTFQSLTLQAESLSWSPMGFTNCLWRSPYQQVCIPNTNSQQKSYFSSFVNACFQEGQGWSLIESGRDLGSFAAVLIPDKHLLKQQNTKKL